MSALASHLGLSFVLSKMRGCLIEAFIETQYSTNLTILEGLFITLKMFTLTLLSVVRGSSSAILLVLMKTTILKKDIIYYSPVNLA